MATYLSEIVAAHRASAARDERDVDDLVRAARRAPATGGFRGALCGGRGLGVIAEIKRRSPSKGDLAPSLDPVALAGAYRRGGARCLSVLTDADYFLGCPEDLAAARAAASLPVLRKDFTVAAADVCDTRLMGADCVLLIVAALSTAELAEFHALAKDLGLDALVEVHDEAELEVALQLGADLVGVNQRDLATFEVDKERARRLAGAIPKGVVAVAESGIGGADDAAGLADAGYDAVLVGESLVRAPDPVRALGALSGHRVRPRSDRLQPT